MARLLCYFGLHKWTEHVTEGERYFKCRRCAKYADKAASIFRYGGQR